MVFNTLLGRKEICELMLDHTATKLVLAGKIRIIANKYGYIPISLFGFPLDPVNRIRARNIFNYLSRSTKKEKGTLLDVGCSFGVYSYELAKIGYDVTGIDTNKESIDLANKIKRLLDFKNISFQHQNILSNDFPAKKFDLVIMIEALEHIKEDRKVIQEFNRILKDDGIVIISVPYAEEIEEYVEPIGACRTLKGDTVCIGDGGGHYRNGYNLRSLTSLLENNGFTVMHQSYTCIPKIFKKSIIWFPLVYPLSLLFARFSRNRFKLNICAKKAIQDEN